MNVDVEDVLRDGLIARGSRLGLESDPWGRFAGAQRAHRRQRRRRAALSVAAVVALGGLVQTNVLPLPGWAPAVPVSALVAGSVFADAPARGSLAGDQAWLDGLRAAVQDVSEDEGVWRVGDRNDIRVLFAEDVPGRRLALLVVPLRLGVVEVEDVQWYAGPPGAAAAQMTKHSNSDATEEILTWGESDERGATAVVVGAPGSRVELSAGARFGADGRVARAWEVVGGDGVGWTTLPPGALPGKLAARVTQPGRQPVETPVQASGIGAAAPLVRSLPPAVTATTRGSKPARVLLQVMLEQAFVETGLDSRNTRVRVPWAGSIRGQDALVLTLQPVGGGVLVFAARGNSELSQHELRLLLPAAGAQARPVAWRLRAEGGGEARSPQVAVVAPEGAVRVDLVAGGRALPVEVDATGAGIVDLDPAVPGTVRAYRADGSVLGELPVPQLEQNSGGVPGGTRETRIVD